MHMQRALKGIPAIQSPAVRYTYMAMVLHWITAALVLFMFALGWYMVSLPTEGGVRTPYFALHKSLGLLIILVTAARLWWRLRHPAPPLPEHLPAWQNRLAYNVHRLFYVMLFVHPTFGYLSAEFAGYGTRFFGIKLYNWGWKDQGINEFFTECHEITALVLLLLILCHLAGALSHIIKPGDRLARRMWPW